MLKKLDRFAEPPPMPRVTASEDAVERIREDKRRLCDHCQSHLPRCFHDTLCAQATADRERRFWQPSRHPEAIQSEAFWQQKLDYLHDNPRRKGLVRAPEHWRLSSAGWYLAEGKEPAEVPITAIAW